MYALTVAQPNWDIRRHLSLDIGDVHVRAAGRVSRPGQQRAEFRFAEMSTVHQQKVVDDDAFLFQRARHRGRRARRDPADIRVVPA
jgi:hypothetical protein